MRSVAVGIMLAAATACFGQRAEAIRLDISQESVAAEGAQVALSAFDPEKVISGERDGRWTTSVRLSSPGAYGLQFLFEDLHLPAGAMLYVYEVDAFGEPTAARGVYDGSGPLGTGQFWSDAVRGSEALIEVVYEGGAVGALPFRLSAARHLTEEGYAKLARRLELPEALARPDLEGTTGRTMFRGVEVPYEIRNGLGVFEGDILLGPADELPSATGLATDKSGRRQGMGLTNTYYRWPGGVIPYTIDPALPNQGRVTDAVAHWNNTLGGVIRLIPRTTETYYVRFAYTTNAGTCSSYVGMYRITGGQPVTLGDYCSTGNAIHEIGHAVGLFHEHTREDRDSYVRIVWANVNTSATANFSQNISSSDDLGTYDYGSIMHYPAVSFSINGLPTIETIPAGIPIGQRSALSAGDINAARTMYGAGSSTTPPSTVQVTLASNPVGRQLVVDGATVTAPVSYQWTVGSLHTISAPSLQVGSTQYLFASWSDGGAQTHTVTTPGSAAAYTASFATRHRVTASSSNTSLGSVALSPYSADAFYNEGASVTLSGAPSGSACLTSWTGISAPASSPVQVGVSQPYSIVGNFQTGAVSVSPSSWTFSWKGGTINTSVTASTGCQWTASKSASWITITSGGSGTSSGTFRYSVARNDSKTARYGTINVGAATIYISQGGK